MSDDRRGGSKPVNKIVDVKTGQLVTVYVDLDGIVLGWERMKEREQ